MSMSGLSAFLTATGALPPAGVSTNVIADRKSVLNAFSTLDLDLKKGPNGEVLVTSSARDLMNQRKLEKEQEKVYEQQAQIQREQAKIPIIETALTQAVASFAAETDEMYLPKTSLPSSKKGRNVSRRARQRQESNKERMENYSNKIKMKSTMQVKKSERKEKYKRVY